MTADITIVGLGPGPAELRTVAAQQALDAADRIFIRNHAGADFGDLLSRANVTDVAGFRDPDAASGKRWQASAQAVTDAATHGPVVLAIPGHPRFGEMLTVETLTLAEERGLTVEVLDGISMIDLLCTALNIDAVRDRVQLMDGRNILHIETGAPFSGGEFGATPRLPMLITHVYGNAILRLLTSQLLRILPPEHRLTLISEAGLTNEARSDLSLAELADHAGGPLLAIFVPPLGDLDATRTPATLQHIVARLRRDDGCPWDRKQTNETMAQSLVDEVYEVIDAIDAGDDVNLAEELGDLLLLIMMHAQIAEERRAFRLEDVYHGIATKIVRRHPHVFGDLIAENADDVVDLWQQVKDQEKGVSHSKPEKAGDGQPHSMPVLTRAARVLAKYPTQVRESTTESRQQALLDAIAAIVVAGDNPDEVLKSALENHVSGAANSADQGETHASR